MYNSFKFDICLFSELSIILFKLLPFILNEILSQLIFEDFKLKNVLKLLSLILVTTKLLCKLP